MPARSIPFATDEFYHVYNRGINKQPIFLGVRDYQRALDILEFYSFASSKLRFSKFILLPKEKRMEFWNRLRKDNKRLVEIICFCLMPNHFHFLLKQKKENGISTFMRILQNSYTRYFNTKHTKIGPILQGQFKAVRVEDEDQLLHLSRYIHLNPFSSFVIKKKEDLINYSWSSFSEYIKSLNASISNHELILSFFKNREDYKKFVFDQADYQRELEIIKHLVME